MEVNILEKSRDAWGKKYTAYSKLEDDNSYIILVDRKGTEKIVEEITSFQEKQLDDITLLLLKKEA